MFGHPAIAYMTALHTLEARRNAAQSRQQARRGQRARSVRLGSYRMTVSKEQRDVSDPV